MNTIDVITIINKDSKEFTQVWENYKKDNSSWMEDDYLAFIELAGYLVDIYKQGKLAEFSKTIKHIDDFYTELDAITQEKVRTGLIETLQNMFMGAGVEFSTIEKLLGPYTLKEWIEVKEMWERL